MANELTLSASLAFAKGNANTGLSKGGLQVTVTGTQYLSNIQSVGFAAEEALVVSEGTLGYCFMRNNDATNYVEVRPGTGVADLIRLNAGEIALFRFAADVTAPFVQANTAAVELEYIIIET